MRKLNENNAFLREVVTGSRVEFNDLRKAKEFVLEKVAKFLTAGSNINEHGSYGNEEGAGGE
jgi:hypothetical protein